MSGKNYIFSKLYVLLIAIFVSAFQIAFLIALKQNRDTIIMFEIVFWLMIFGVLLIEYIRKAHYYNKLLTLTNTLDKKYLLTELINEPEFLDGKILYNILESTNKNYNDRISDFHLREKDYQEYVELWVHEIKTPLAASKLIVANNPSEVTKSIDEELDKVQNFVDQALFYARSTSLEKDYIIKEVNLQDIVHKCIKKYQQTFLIKKIRIEMRDIDRQIYSDQKWLEFILNQLLDNALKYSNINGSLTLSTKSLHDGVELHIQDNGIGICEADMQRIFTRGFTGENGRQHSQATGMGLYLCKLLCDKLYIGLRISSKQAKGTRVVLTFPINSMTKFR